MNKIGLEKLYKNLLCKNKASWKPSRPKKMTALVVDTTTATSSGCSPAPSSSAAAAATSSQQQRQAIGFHFFALSNPKL
jgi:hypothetical protein